MPIPTPAQFSWEFVPDGRRTRARIGFRTDRVGAPYDLELPALNDAPNRMFFWVCWFSELMMPHCVRWLAASYVADESAWGRYGAAQTSSTCGYTLK